MCSLFASFISCAICSSFSALTTTSGICAYSFPAESLANSSIFSISVRTFRSPKIFLNSPRVSGVTFLYSISTSSLLTTGYFLFPEFLNKDGQDLQCVPHYAKIAHLKDWGIRVIVNGYHNVSGTHPGNVLDRTGNPSCNIQTWTHRFPRETHLMRVGDPAHVDRLPGGSYRAIEQVCKFMEQVEVLGVLQPFAAGDDHVRFLDG